MEFQKEPVQVKFISYRIVVLYLLLASVNLVSGNICSTPIVAPATNGFPDPGLPYIQNTFQVSVEANLLDQQRTVAAKIYYDYPGNRAMVRFYENGQEGSIVFNYATDELFYINGNGNCTAMPVTGSKYTTWFGVKQLNGSPHIKDTQTALRFGNTYNETYMGNNTVRGIPVYHWRSCINNTMLVDYYFSRQSNWTTATSTPSVPVRAQVAGEMRQANGSVHTYNHTYDFFNFIPSNSFGDILFQTPTHLICHGQKSGKALPTLPTRFHYRTELIYEDLTLVTFEDTWYDEQAKLYRRDYRPLLAQPPHYSMNPITEIHDYNTGVRYVKDRTLGNCSTMALSSSLQDSSRNLTAINVNGSLVLNLKNPLQLFNLDNNYTYTGQHMVRNVLCDTYVGQTQHLTMPGGLGNSKMATITFYFLSKGWIDTRDDERAPTTTVVPIKMDVITSDGTSVTYNFVDFDPEPTTIDVFDISSCFSEANKVTFQVKFPGTVMPINVPSLKTSSQSLLATTMGVSLLRISDVQLTYDDANVFVTATLLDTTATTAQFTKIVGKVLEYDSTSVIYDSSGPVECARFCVNNMGFTCNSFDYCSNDLSCHLNKLHSEDGPAMISNRTCNHYSRNVDGIKREVNIMQAYQKLRERVYNRTLILTSNGGNTIFKAVDVVVIFGWVNPNVQPPTLGNQFSYRSETTIPSSNHVYSSGVWYDRYFQLIRYDTHVDTAIYPFYTTNPLTVVEDFNTGIKYVTDTMLLNCSMSQLTSRDYGTISHNVSSGHDLTLKNPLAAFDIDNSYKFVGQQTIRGMTCNIFEALIPDYEFYNTTVAAVFRYAFLASEWVETSDGYLGGDSGQPIRLDITIPAYSFYMVTNIFDYDTDHADMSVFDIHHCFTPEQTVELEVVFPGLWNPAMNRSSNIFKIEVLDRLVNVTGASRLRFQQLQLDHDDTHLYLYISLVEQTDTYLYFTEIAGSPVPEHVDKVVSMVGGSLKRCLDICLDYSDFRCNSFYFCEDSAQCLLSRDPVPYATVQTSAPQCVSFSRTVNETVTEPVNTVVTFKLKNAVYYGQLQTEIPVPNSQKTTYFKAKFVNDVSKTRRGHNKQDNHLAQFEKLDGNICLQGLDDDLILNYMALDDCATQCVTSIDIQCRGFSYRQVLTTEGYFLTCYLTKYNPDSLNATMFTRDPTCVTYSRHYKDDYINSSGLVSAGITSNMVSVQSDEDCAKACYSQPMQACKMLQYCPNTKHCLMFKDRTFTLDSNSNDGSCFMFTAQYFTDFTAVNAGTYDFHGILTYIGVGLPDCANYCVQQLGRACTGYYYSRYTQTCYLTGEQPGTGSVTQSDTGDMCNQYHRSSSTPASVSMATTPTPTRASAQPPIVPTTRGSAQPPIVPTTRASEQPPAVVTCPTGHQAVTSTPPYHIPTPLSQQTSDNVKSKDTGLLIGIPVGTFVLGLVIGVVMLHFIRRYKNLDRDLKTNFIEHEEM